ncbi:MAG: phage tail protein [Firmicutes bacterium]|nr:phage tail protein [Bacillota bacterium]
MAAKVKFNIKNAHYAPKTQSGWGTPVAIPGAVSASLEPQGELTPFYADGIKYYISGGNGGYEGDVEFALIPDAFRKAILGEAEDANHVLWEDADANPVEFAFGFDVDTDDGVIKFWFYNCTASRPKVEAETKEDTVEPKTDTITISCAPGSDGRVRAKTTDDTTSTVLNAWYESVYEYAASAAPSA